MCSEAKYYSANEQQFKRTPNKPCWLAYCISQALCQSLKIQKWIKAPAPQELSLVEKRLPELNYFVMEVYKALINTKGRPQLTNMRCLVWLGISNGRLGLEGPCAILCSGILDFILWVIGGHWQIEHKMAACLHFRPITLVMECRKSWRGKRWDWEAGSRWSKLQGPVCGDEEKEWTELYYEGGWSECVSWGKSHGPSYLGF